MVDGLTWPDWILDDVWLLLQGEERGADPAFNDDDEEQSSCWYASDTALLILRNQNPDLASWSSTIRSDAWRQGYWVNHLVKEMVNFFKIRVRDIEYTYLMYKVLLNTAGEVRTEYNIFRHKRRMPPVEFIVDFAG